MEKEFVGFIIENNKQKRASFIINTNKNILACQRVGFFSGVLGGSGALGAALSSSTDLLKKKNTTIYNISNIISADFFRFGLTSQAILIKTDTDEIRFMSATPKNTLSILQSMIEENK